MEKKHDIDLSIASNLYPIVFKDIITNEEYIDLKEELESISQVELDNWLNPKEKFTSTDTFPLYLMGFKPSEIANIRGVSRQVTTIKVDTEISNILNIGVITSEEEIKEEHLINRKSLRNIVLYYYVNECGKQKDIELMTNVLSSKYRSNRAKYVVYLKLGGDSSVFDISKLDKRYVSREDSEELNTAFDMFEKGHSNREVADVLNLTIPRVYYFRKKYYRINSPSDLID